MNAPASAMNPPSSHAPRISAGVCTCRATTYGLMKIPAPTIPPMTIIVASNRPSRRAKPVAAASGDERTCFSVGDIALRDKGSDGGVLYHRSRRQPSRNPGLDAGCVDFGAASWQYGAQPTQHFQPQKGGR